MSIESFKKHIEAKLLKKQKKKHKFGAKRVDQAGYSFGSKLEAAVFNILNMQLLAGEIANIQVQDSIYLTRAEILYKPDFKITRLDGSFYWVEAKGFKTPVWGIKKRLWKHYGPGLLQIYEGYHNNPKLEESIVPKGMEKMK